LVKVIETTEDEDTRRWAAESLGNTRPRQSNGDRAALVNEVLKTTESEDTRSEAAESLGEIITTDEHRKIVVTALQPYFNTETYENNFNLFKNCYEILWDIAQDLPYPGLLPRMAWFNLNLYPCPNSRTCRTP
jgi:hypothetical protein